MLFENSSVSLPVTLEYIRGVGGRDQYENDVVLWCTTVSTDREYGLRGIGGNEGGDVVAC